MTRVLPAGLQNYHPNANIGDRPHPWNGYMGGYTHAAILRLVIFYNNDVGINLQDRLPARKAKLKGWLTDQD